MLSLTRPVRMIPAAAALLAPGGAHALGVVSSSPTPYALAVPGALSQVSVTFDAAPLPPPAGAVRISGTMSGVHPVSVSLNGAILTATVTGAWLPGEMVHVNVRRDVRATAADSLGGGHYFAFTIATGAAPMAFNAPRAYGAAQVPYFIFGGDVNGDGHPDVTVPNEGTDDFSVWLNDGSGSLSARTDYAVGTTPSSCFGEDFDNDGDLDLATADIASNTVSVALNNGDGTFAPSVQHAAGTTTRQVYGGDFDGDNDVDLCATSTSTDEVYFFTNDGTGVFSAGIPYTAVPDAPFAIETGDFDLDGHLDVVVAGQSSVLPADSLYVLRNDGTGSFTTTGKYHGGDGPWDIAVNDMDGDGDADVAMVTSFNNRLKTLINDGTGAFPGRKGVATSAFPLAVHIADMDGDGDLDAMSSHFNGASVGVFSNDGAANLTLRQNLFVDRTGSFSWAHDLDGDGDLDLSVVDELADSLFVFLNEPPVGAPAVTGAGGGGPAVRAQPNPAPGSGSTLFVRGMPGEVTIDVLDIAGRRLRRLFEGVLPADGSVPWDGRGESGRPLPAGAYVVVSRSVTERAAVIVRLIR